MISIIIKCDRGDRSQCIEDLTQNYGVTSLKQAYFMIKNWEIPWREVVKKGEDYFHYYTDEALPPTNE